MGQNVVLKALSWGQVAFWINLGFADKGCSLIIELDFL